MMECYDCIIIGAGISGLSAARRLKARMPDINLRVLEASNRVGGRTCSIQGQSGMTLDLGGQWVCDSQPHILKLMEELSISHYPQFIKGKKIFQGRDNRVRTYKSDIPAMSPLSLIKLQWLMNKVEKITKGANIRNPAVHPDAEALNSMTMQQLVAQYTNDPDVHDMWEAGVATLLGCPSSDMSALFYLAYANGSGGVMKQLLAKNGGAQEYKVKGGSHQISKAMAEDLGEDALVFNAKVTNLSQNDTEVTVTCDNGVSYQAKHVISAIPTPVLAKIQFVPDLPEEKKRLFASSYMGNLAKVWVVYRNPFWRNQGYSGEIVSTGGPTSVEGCTNGPLIVVYDATDDKGNAALVGFLASKGTTEWFQKPLEVRKKAVLDQLVSYFGPEAHEPLEYLDKDWSQDEFIGGAPAAVFPANEMMNHKLIRESHGLVAFAGTEVATLWPGYMSGAVQAGYKAAAEIVARICKDKLTAEDKELMKDFEALPLPPKRSSSKSCCTIC